VKLSLLLCSFALVASVAEAWLRLLPERDSVAFRRGREKPRFNPYVSSGVFAYELRPDWSCRHDSADFDVTVRTNALGLRGAPASLRKTPGTYRILVLGDSFAFGFGVEDDETLPAYLDHELGGRAAGIEVLNAAVPGWATDLVTTGFALEPDLVILTLFQNDPAELMWHRISFGEERLPRRIQSTQRMIDQRGRMHYVNDAELALPRMVFPGQSLLRDHSHLYHWLRYRLTRLWVAWALRRGEKRRSTDEGPGPPGPMESLAPEQIQRGLETSARFRLRYHRFLLDAIQTLCAERGVALRFLQYHGRGPAPEPGSDAAEMHEDCAARGSHCLNTLNLFPPEERAALFLPLDGHPSAEGHARVAAAVARWLRDDPDLSLPSRSIPTRSSDRDGPI
jgi:hypothetical protein